MLRFAMIFMQQEILMEATMWDDSANKYYRIANISKYATQVKITDENVIKHYGMINIST